MIIENSLPQGFIDSIVELPGIDMEAFESAMNSEPSVAIRLNTRKPLSSMPYADMTPVAWSSSAYYLTTRPQFTLNPLLHAGSFYVQDASSAAYETMIQELLKHNVLHLGSQPLKVFDMCAAPGGKTTAMINALPDDSIIVANEYIGKRAAILTENLDKWGFPNVIVTNDKTSSIASSGALFDIVAVDAPCSGEGMMRKEEEARQQWSHALVDQCATLQREILSDAVKVLKPGGVLIYSTCTFNPRENEMNAGFIANELNLKPLDIDIPGLPMECKSISTEICNSGVGSPGIRFMPHFTQGEGLFISIFQKPAENNASEFDRNMLVHQNHIKHTKGNKRNPTAGNYEAADLHKILKIGVSENYVLSEKNGKISIVFKEMLPLYEKLAHNVHIISAGIKAFEVKGKDLIPQTPLALSCILEADAFPRVSLDEDNALKYLRRDNIILPSDTPKGYVLIQYNDTPLGFAKHLGNRTNNLYPMQWRIKHL